MAYVVLSRGAHDVQLFTNDREQLREVLGHDVSHLGAHAPEVELDEKTLPKHAHHSEIGLGQ
jgi:thiamine monophosphate synthase